MDFGLHLVRHDRYTVVEVRGELDLVSRDRFEETMLDVVETGQALIVDMHDVTFCDSTGLNAVVGANRRAAGAGVPLVLVALTERVRRIFHITAVDRFIPVYDSLEEAVGALPSATH
ncbi:Anti-sigma-B factor antagonist [Actinomadura rubteroloni]|uniref:Anti-sigma factor antagonist n=1 Tax=Actinomadura rubteroloni TaxID=1926885 RepID=A0A2P4ULN8_9ACTN|nr:STAS domain-containing protein [Actinomadura rubteroloni]POM25960.1 Anti-sigma-B factor antagonist [Actinomadura rubteroloni]